MAEARKEANEPTPREAEQLLGEVMLFEPVQVQNYLHDEFMRDFSPIAAIQHGAPIEFNIPGATQLYHDLNNSLLRVRARIMDAAGNAPDANVHPSVVNNVFNSMWRDHTLSMNGRQITEPNNMYAWRALMEDILNFSMDVQNTRLQCQCWHRDTAGQLAVRAHNGDNVGHNRRAAKFAQGHVVEMVGRPHIDMFHQDKLIPPGINLNYRLLPAADTFVIRTPDGDDVQYRFVIETVQLLMRTKQLTEPMEVAHRTLVQNQSMRLPHTRVLMKHLSVAAGLGSIAFDNVFTSALPDLVIMGMVTDETFVGGYHQPSPFNFQHFNVNRVDMKVNSTPRPSAGYTPSWADGNYIKDYMTFLSELGYDTGDKCAQISPTEWANGYTLFAFKLTPGPIGSGVAGPRTHAKSGNARLELSFAQPTQENIKIVLMYQSPAVLEVDLWNNVVLT